tara:strand:- start:330 stop:686 length:357 start_codon:yes stop_codon:yes gene_type:complete
MTDIIDTQSSNNVDFISAEEFDLENHEMGDTFHTLSEQYSKKLGIPKGGPSRKEVVMAFESAFHLVGGVPRLALWAHEHPGEFYKLYGRLLPSQSSEALGESNEMTIRHVIPRGVLDQ